MKFKIIGYDITPSTIGRVIGADIEVEKDGVSKRVGKLKFTEDEFSSFCQLLGQGYVMGVCDEKLEIIMNGVDLEIEKKKISILSGKELK